MIAKDLVAERIIFADKAIGKTLTLKAQVKTTNARKERIDIKIVVRHARQPL